MSVVHSDLLIAASDAARAVRVVAQGQALTGKAAAWAEANGFTGKAGQLLIVPGDDGAAAEALFGAGEA
ncbi:MAG: leucyl aminopeptidase family protein, partial [Brevundimonas sp.]